MGGGWPDQARREDSSTHHQACSILDIGTLEQFTRYHRERETPRTPYFTILIRNVVTVGQEVDPQYSLPSILQCGHQSPPILVTNFGAGKTPKGLKLHK